VIGVFTWRTRGDGNKRFRWWNARYAGKKVAGYVRRDGYIGIDFELNGERFKCSAHRLAWLYVYGDLLEFQVDHINRVKTDNRIINLRLASGSQNTHNAAVHKRNKLGLKGIHWDKEREKFSADIQILGKRKRLGRFDSLEEAKAAYAAASLSYAKEFSIFSEVAA